MTIELWIPWLSDGLVLLGLVVMTIGVAGIGMPAMPAGGGAVGG